MIDPLIGKTLGPYLLQDRIGAGGMGAVYRAVHQALDQPRAVKILPPGLSADPAFVTRFVREARLAARLRHPNVVQVFDVGSHDGIHFLAMELLEGRSLRDVQREAGVLPTDRAIALLRQLASALDAAHAMGIVHRDVKPANAIVGPDDHLTLVDFGIARAIETTALTGSGLIGTPGYMAPELIRGDLAGPGIDLYALGMVGFELLTGHPPFPAASVPALLHSHLHASPPCPSEVRTDLPLAVDAIVLRQLAKAPAARYPSGEAFQEALEQACARPEPTVTPRPVSLDAPDPPARSDPESIDLADAAPPTNRRRGKDHSHVSIGKMAAIGFAIILIASAQFLIRLPLSAGITTTIAQLTSTGRATIAEPGVEGSPTTRSPAVPDWAGTARINVLLLGVDSRDGEPIEYSRADAIMIASIDPESKSAVLISLPGNLYVNIPGYSQDRLSASHSVGGPALTIKPIETNLSIQLHSYIRVNFPNFERIIDAFGGVFIDMEHPFKDDEYPTNDFGTMRLFIPPGPTLLDGKTALMYARSKHGDDDFGRAIRQQRLLLALRERALQVDLAMKLPTLVQLIETAITTDMSVASLLQWLPSKVIEEARGGYVEHDDGRVDGKPDVDAARLTAAG